MATLKTQKNDADPIAFINQIQQEQKRKDAHTILEMMQEVTDAPPEMWGDSIIGFGSYHYRYKSGREGDWFLTGFSPRKTSLSLYIMGGFKPRAALLEKLGKHKNSKACLYINKLADVNLKVLRELITDSVNQMRAKDSSH
ncbi:MAG: DUF1801 domain-containing protein [Owenweeksia sp.]|nr:DUF1801 domain-containing protein [Owenweeksia sp.]